MLFLLCISYVVLEAGAASVLLADKLGPWVAEELASAEFGHAMRLYMVGVLVVVLCVVQLVAVRMVIYLRHETSDDTRAKLARYWIAQATTLLSILVFFGILMAAVVKVGEVCYLWCGGDEGVPEQSLKAYRFYCVWPMFVMKGAVSGFLEYFCAYSKLVQRYGPSGAAS